MTSHTLKRRRQRIAARYKRAARAEAVARRLREEDRRKWEAWKAANLQRPGEGYNEYLLRYSCDRLFQELMEDPIFARRRGIT